MLQAALKEKMVVEEENLLDYEGRIKWKVKSLKQVALYGEFFSNKNQI